MTTSFAVVRLPPERDPSDLILHLVEAQYQFIVTTKTENVARFMQTSEDAAGTSTFSQLSRTAEAQIDPQLLPENPDFQSVNAMELFSEDDVKKEEIKDIEDYGIDNSYQTQKMEGELDESECGTREAIDRTNDDDKMSCVEPKSEHSLPTDDVYSEFLTDLPLDGTEIPTLFAATDEPSTSNSKIGRRKYFSNTSSKEGSDASKILFPVKTVAMKRKQESSPLFPSWNQSKFSNIHLQMPGLPTSPEREKEVKIGDSLRARGIMKPLPQPEDRTSVHLPISSMEEAKAFIAQNFDELLDPVQHHWKINRIIALLGKGHFFAYNFTTPLQQAYAPRFLDNFCNPRDSFPTTPLCPGSLFFYAQVSMEDQPWLYLCPGTITDKFRFRRFVFVKKGTYGGVVNALFQYVIEEVDPECSTNTQILRSRTFEIDNEMEKAKKARKDSAKATIVERDRDTVKIGGVLHTRGIMTPLPSSSEETSEDVDVSNSAPPNALSRPPLLLQDLDPQLHSLIAGLRSHGFYFADSFLEPLAMRVIPSILDNVEKTVIACGSPLNFTMHGSFFRVSLVPSMLATDGFSPWTDKRTMKKTIGERVTVTRYSYSHPKNLNFKRFVFSTGLMKNRSDLVVVQYVVPGPIPAVPWRGRIVPVGNDAYRTPTATDCTLDSPRSASTLRVIRIPSGFQKHPDSAEK